MRVRVFEVVNRKYLVPDRVGVVLDDLCLLLGPWEKMEKPTMNPYESKQL